MDLNKNYYGALGVDKNASQEEIKKAYRQMAKKHHPDATQNHDDSKFKEINESFGIIGDETERQKYDTQSPHGRNYQPGFGPFFRMNINGQDFNPFGFDPFNDSFFSSIFRRKEEFVENLDIHAQINVTLKDVYKNTNIPIRFTRNVRCETCNHTGFDPESEAFDCDACDGKGGDGFTRCRYCGGTGKIHSGTCKTCNGNKVISKEEELASANTHSIRGSSREYIREKGHQSKYYYNKIGNLILDINYNPDNRYIIDGRNLIYPLNLHFQHAIDGYEFHYEHLDDKKYSLKIPPKTKDGDLLRVSKKGLLIDHQNRGDLIVKINIIIDYDLLK